MKKLVLFMAVATAVAFASCGNKEAKTEEAAACESAAEVETVVEEVVETVDTVAAEVVEVVDTVAAEAVVAE